MTIIYSKLLKILVRGLLERVNNTRYQKVPLYILGKFHISIVYYCCEILDTVDLVYRLSMIRIGRKDMVVIMLSLNNNPSTFVLFRVNNWHEVDLISVASSKHEAIAALEHCGSEVTIWNGPSCSTIFTEPKKNEHGFDYIVAVNNGHICKGLFLDIEGHYHDRIKAFQR